MLNITDNEQTYTDVIVFKSVYDYVYVLFKPVRKHWLYATDENNAYYVLWMNS